MHVRLVTRQGQKAMKHGFTWSSRLCVQYRVGEDTTEQKDTPPMAFCRNPSLPKLHDSTITVTPPLLPPPITRRTPAPIVSGNTSRTPASSLYNDQKQAVRETLLQAFADPETAKLMPVPAKRAKGITIRAGKHHVMQANLFAGLY